MCFSLGQLKTSYFPSGTNGKLMVLSVPILKHFRVCGDDTGYYLLNCRKKYNYKT